MKITFANGFSYSIDKTAACAVAVVTGDQFDVKRTAYKVIRNLKREMKSGKEYIQKLKSEDGDKIEEIWSTRNCDEIQMDVTIDCKFEGRSFEYAGYKYHMYYVDGTLIAARRLDGKSGDYKITSYGLEVAEETSLADKINARIKFKEVQDDIIDELHEIEKVYGIKFGDVSFNDIKSGVFTCFDVN